MKVMVLGSTGLTGGLLVKRLLGNPGITTVVAPVRRPLEWSHPNLDAPVIDFDDMNAHAGMFHVDVLVCCLGTTIKKAGSQDAFRKVDYSYALNAARLAKEAGAKACILMSAIGASPNSSVFYSRVKGELEEAVRALEFPYLSIYQPSLLLGQRQEHRTAEGLGMAVMPVANRALVGPLRKYRAIGAETIAVAMANEISRIDSGPRAGVQESVQQYSDIVALAGL
ncbi:NAD(P)H-binding protein [Marinobacter litoralis]|uniref:NAD(P)H-binding protein n=1 Tax=Marinobacter litoralis TaxID=187981 RepID=UPI0018EB325F|nr:NAD(P)H-binding protein [Marinobacter litoralis]MBJ6137092.1 NAD(P)H-binding protein [Marinobacter litoralis]